MDVVQTYVTVTRGGEGRTLSAGKPPLTPSLTQC